MKAFSAVSSLFTLVAVLGTAAAKDVRGVDPAVAASYVPSKDNTFACLDGKGVIPFSAVNDDYCDCADGSDEPGTSACEGRPAAYFYCENKGHIPGKLLAGRVNDGLCDPECCDGSDEWASGACPDRCAEVAREYKERTEAEMKTRRTGAKIRSAYVSFALKEKKRLEDELVAKKGDLTQKEGAVEEARVALENAEAKSKDVLERKKASPLFKALEARQDAVTKLRSQLERVNEDLDTITKILEELSKGYNPNGQDMAVKAAVIGYRELVGGQPVEGGAEGEVTQGTLYTKLNPDGEIKRSDLDFIASANLEALLADDDDDDDDEGLLYRLEEYIPDSLYDYYDAARDHLVKLLTGAGILKKAAINDAPHVSAARDKFHAVERERSTLTASIKSIEETLDKITTSQGYGPQGEWKKLDGTCIDTVAGDYTYELCFFGRVTQKSNKDSSSTHIGTFAEWNPAAPLGTFEHYTKQAYRNGAKCWNGPMRSVNVDLSCGTANAILSITEPEKCEYRFKVTTPALCWPLEGAAPVGNKEADPNADPEADGAREASEEAAREAMEMHKEEVGGPKEEL